MDFKIAIRPANESEIHRLQKASQMQNTGASSHVQEVMGDPPAWVWHIHQLKSVGAKTMDKEAPPVVIIENN